MKYFLPIFLVLFLLTSCSTTSWIGADEEGPRLEGERIAVLPSISGLLADPALEQIKVVLPEIQANTSWATQRPQSLYHPQVSGDISGQNNVNIGSTPEDGLHLSALPIVANKKLFVIDGGGQLTARDTSNPKHIIWERDLRGEEIKDNVLGFEMGKARKAFLGGSIAYSNNLLFVTLGDGRVLTLDASNGQVIWERSFGIPIKSPPVPAHDRLFFLTLDNKFYAVDIHSGKTLLSHAGITEDTTLMGSPSVLVQNNVTVIPYSSGEIYALDITNGKVLWGDTLATSNRYTTQLFSLTDIDATPVIQGKTLYASSHEGVLAAMDLANGNVLWERHISTLKTPWVAGNFLFLITTKDEIVAIYTPTGGIKWIAKLPSFIDEEEKQGKIVWSGPILAKNKLFIVGSHGELVAVSPFSGKILDSVGVEEDIFLPPIVANNRMYLLTNDAELIILQ